MSLKFGANSVNTVIYNGNDVKRIVFNGSNAWAKPYALTISKGTGVDSVSVSRTSTLEPTASTGSVSAGSGTIFHGDVLTVNATPSAGYALKPYTQNYTVSGDISVSIIAISSMPKLDEPIVVSHVWRDDGGSDILSIFGIQVQNTNTTYVTCNVELYDKNILLGSTSETINANTTTYIYVDTGSSYGYDYEQDMTALVSFSKNGWQSSETEYSLA